MTMSHLESAVGISRALANPGRLRTVAMLRTGELCVCQVTAVLELAQSTVSNHLRELKRAGLISERKDGRWVYFALADDPNVRPWLDAALATAADDPRLAADAIRVAEIRALPVDDLCRLGFEAARAKTRTKDSR